MGLGCIWQFRESQTHSHTVSLNLAAAIISKRRSLRSFARHSPLESQKRHSVETAHNILQNLHPKTTFALVLTSHSEIAHRFVDSVVTHHMFLWTTAQLPGR